MTVYEEILTGEYSMSRRVAATIRKLRKQKKSLRAMAIKAGISTSQVYKAQRHYKGMTIEFAEKFLDILGYELTVRRKEIKKPDESET